MVSTYAPFYYGRAPALLTLYPVSPSSVGVSAAVEEHLRHQVRDSEAEQASRGCRLIVGRARQVGALEQGIKTCEVGRDECMRGGVGGLRSASSQTMKLAQGERRRPEAMQALDKLESLRRRVRELALALEGVERARG